MAEEHGLSVFDIRRSADQRIQFVAVCECGWRSGPRRTREIARASLGAHIARIVDAARRGL